MLAETENFNSCVPGNCSDAPRPTVGDAARVAQIVSIAVIDISCVVGNFILIFTIARCRRLHTISNMLILNLGISDMLLALFILPLWAVTTSRQDAAFSPALCYVIAALTLGLFLESIATLGGIAIDRYINICHPLRYMSLLTDTRAGAFIVFTWVQSAILALLPVFNFGSYGFYVSAIPICSVDYLANLGYSVTLIIVGIIPYCVVIIVCYYIIFKTAREQARKISDLYFVVTGADEVTLRSEPTSQSVGKTVSAWLAKTKQNQPEDVDCRPRAGSSFVPENNSMKTLSVPGTHLRPRSSSAPSSPVHKKLKPAPPQVDPEKLWRKASKVVKTSVSRSRALRTILTIIGFFLLCWIPYIVMLLYTVISQSSPAHATEFTITYLAFTNSLANPIICFVVNREYRRSIPKAFSNQRRALLRASINAFMEATGQVPPRSGPRGGSVGSDITSEASDLAVVRRLYQAYMEKYNGTPGNSMNTNPQVRLEHIDDGANGDI